MLDWLSGTIQIQEVLWARPAPLTIVLAVAVGVLLFSLFLYRKPRGVPRPVRAGLLAMRLLALGILLALLCEPTVVIRSMKQTKRRLAVMIDVSQSMSIRDQRKRPADLAEAAMALGMLPLRSDEEAAQAVTALDIRQREAIENATRIDLAGGLLLHSARPLLDALHTDLDIDYYVFGTNVTMLGEAETLTEESLRGLLAEKRGTSIADSLEAVTRSAQDVELAGIVLLSDGLDTSSRQAEGTLRELGIRKIPVYPVPVGLTDPDDVSIRNVVMQDVAFSGDKVPVRVQILSKGYEKREVGLSVRLNGRRVTPPQQVRLQGGLQFEDIFFNVDQHRKGAAEVEIALETFPDEATARNNVVERSMRIVNEKINVLCIEGSARWEYRYLRAMLKRDPRINATFIASRAGPAIARNSSEYIPRFPERRAEAFNYDLVILGDVDAEFFSADEFLRLEELVRDRGGSLLMLCGERFSPTSYRGTPVERMLPVRFDPAGEWEDVDDAIYPTLTPEGRSSLVMTLEMDPEVNDRIWSRVAPLNRIPPLLEPRPGATVLATLSDSRSRTEAYPLVAWQRYGTGKCMMIGTDRMWLLRFKTGDKYHWRVWSQCIQFLTLSRLMGEHKRIRLETDRAIYPLDGQVQLYAHLLDERFEPMMQAGFDVLVTPLTDEGAAPRRVTLRPDARIPGLYEGYFSPTQTGRYRVESDAGDRDLSNTTEFQVADTAPEMASTEMQLTQLQRIADLSGGRLLRVPELGSLPAEIDRSRQAIAYVTQAPLWDNAWVALVLLMLMGTEWIVRRTYDLP